MTGKDRRRGLSGWIAEQVLRDAPCPTLIVPTAPVAATPAFDTILCAIDFSPASQAAVNEALRLESTAGRHLTLLHVIDESDNRLWLQYGWHSTRKYYREQRAVMLDTLRFLVPPAQRGVVSTEVVVGEPAAEILRRAGALDASLLVIGTGGRTPHREPALRQDRDVAPGRAVPRAGRANFEGHTGRRRARTKDRGMM